MAEDFRVRKLQQSLIEQLMLSNLVFEEMYGPQQMRQHYLKSLIKLAYGTLRDHWKARIEIMTQLPQSLGYYNICSILFEGEFTHDDSQMLGRNYVTKRDQFYLVRVFKALRLPYLKARELKQRKNEHVLSKTFKQLRLYGLKHASLKYQEEYLTEKKAKALTNMVFQSLKYWKLRQVHLRHSYDEISQKRLFIKKFSILNTWSNLYFQAERKRQQKAISWTMFNNRFQAVYFSRWLLKFRKVQRMKQLNLLRSRVETKRRDKLFLVWLAEVRHREISENLEANLLKNYWQRMKVKVFEALKFNGIKRSRERLIGKIIWERNTHLLALRSLEHWRQRL